MTNLLRIYAEGWRRMGRYYIFSLFLVVLGLPAYLFVYALYYFKGISLNKGLTFSGDPILFSVLVTVSILYCPVAFYLAAEATNQFKAKLSGKNISQNKGIETDAK